MGQFDTIDDELFAERLDYARVAPVPEPPTVRLAERPEASERDPILAIALAALLVLVLVSTGIILWWST